MAAADGATGRSAQAYDPSQTGRQILELEWRVSRELTVVATQNGDESYALDLRWDRSF